MLRHAINDWRVTQMDDSGRDGDFRCSDPDDMQYELLEKGTRYLKENPKGVEFMCKAMEDLRDQSLARGEEKGILKSIKNLIQTTGWSAAEAMTAIGIPESDQPKYAAQL